MDFGEPLNTFTAENAKVREGVAKAHVQFLRAYLRAFRVLRGEGVQ
jgi:hypothetical protein